MIKKNIPAKIIVAVILIINMAGVHAKEIFSCITDKGKIIRVSEIKSPTIEKSGLYRYDFGYPGKPEITLISDVQPYPQGNEMIIEFNNKNITYQVNSTGVDIYNDNGGIMHSVTCISSSIYNNL